MLRGTLVVGVVLLVQGLGSFWRGSVDHCLYYAIALLPCVLGILLTRWMQPQGERRQQHVETRRLLRGILAAVLGGIGGFGAYWALNPWDPVWYYVADFCTIIAACVCAPILEEGFWRGTLYGHLRARVSSLAAVATTSIGYWGAHVVAEHSLDGSATRILYGLIFGLTRMLSGSLAAAIVAHASTSSLILIYAAT